MRHERQTGRTPPALDAMPVLADHLLPVWRDYSRLARSRPYSMAGPLPIPFETLDRYARRYGPHDLGGFDWWFSMISVLDDVKLARARRK
ncbi:MAG: phage tail assembly chaperone [Solirubrobacterales bacterium]